MSTIRECLVVELPHGKSHYFSGFRKWGLQRGFRRLTVEVPLWSHQSTRGRAFMVTLLRTASQDANTWRRSIILIG